MSPNKGDYLMAERIEVGAVEYLKGMHTYGCREGLFTLIEQHVAKELPLFEEVRLPTTMGMRSAELWRGGSVVTLHLTVEIHSTALLQGARRSHHNLKGTHPPGTANMEKVIAGIVCKWLSREYLDHIRYYQGTATEVLAERSRLILEGAL